MMKKNIFIIGTFLFTIFILTGCNHSAANKSSSEATVDKSSVTTQEKKQEDIQTSDQDNIQEDTQSQISLKSLQEQLNDQREKKVNEPLVQSIENIGIVEKGDKSDFTDEEIEKYSTWVHFQNKITRDEAIEDVNELIRLLKNSYAGYNYFGGDEKFNKAKDNMIQRVNETFTEEPSLTYPFYLIVKEELAFIEDSHFRIGRSDSYFEKNNVYYDKNNINFIKENDRYYTTIENQKWYLAKEDEKYSHLTVDDNGELVYGLFGLSDSTSKLPSSIELETQNGETYPLVLKWTITNAGPLVEDQKALSTQSTIHKLYEIDGIPVSTLTRMSIESHDTEMTNAFINEAKELKDRDVFILDLRDNSGGINYIADFFLYNLTGSTCDAKTQMVKRYSIMNKKIENKIKNRKVYSDFSGLDFYNQNKDLADSWMCERECGNKVENGETVIHNNNAEWNKYEHTIIVLINNKTRDSAEYFLTKLSTLANVVIMGTNSNGCLVTDNIIDAEDIYLYNSGIPINYSPTLMIRDDMDEFDVNGWMPDIITREDALDAAGKLVKNNKMK